MSIGINMIKLLNLLLDSKNSAKNRFLINNKIDRETFEDFLNVDITHSKKYIEKMCDLYVNLNISKEDIITVFTVIINRVENGTLKLDIQKIKTKKDFDELKKESEKEHLNVKQRRNQTKVNGSEEVYTDERLTILRIDTREAAILLGKDTTWCISAKNDNHFFKSNCVMSYFEDTDYFIFDNKYPLRHPLSKIIVTVKPEWSSEGGGLRIYTADETWKGKQETEVPKEYLKNELGINLSIFKLTAHKIDNYNKIAKETVIKRYGTFSLEGNLTYSDFYSYNSYTLYCKLKNAVINSTVDSDEREWELNELIFVSGDVTSGKWFGYWKENPKKHPLFKFKHIIKLKDNLKEEDIVNFLDKDKEYLYQLKNATIGKENDELILYDGDLPGIKWPGIDKRNINDEEYLKLFGIKKIEFGNGQSKDTYSHSKMKYKDVELKYDGEHNITFYNGKIFTDSWNSKYKIEWKGKKEDHPFILNGFIKEIKGNVSLDFVVDFLNRSAKFNYGLGYIFKDLVVEYDNKINKLIIHSFSKFNYAYNPNNIIVKIPSDEFTNIYKKNFKELRDGLTPEVLNKKLIEMGLDGNIYNLNHTFSNAVIGYDKNQDELIFYSGVITWDFDWTGIWKSKKSHPISFIRNKEVLEFRDGLTPKELDEFFDDNFLYRNTESHGRTLHNAIIGIDRDEEKLILYSGTIKQADDYYIDYSNI